MKTIAVGMSRDHGAVSQGFVLERSPGCPVDASLCSFGFLPPSQMPHSVRVVGETLPGRDLPTETPSFAWRTDIMTSDGGRLTPSVSRGRLPQPEPVYVAHRYALYSEVSHVTVSHALRWNGCP